MRKPVYKKWWFWLIMLLIVMPVGLSIIVSAFGIESYNNEESTSTAAVVEKVEEKPKKVSLDDKIKKAGKIDYSEKISYEINDDVGKNDGGKIVLIRIKDDGITKKIVDNDATNAFEKLFKIKEVNEVTYFWDATLTDVKGNKSVDTVAKIQMSKETAKTINWDRFTFKNLSEVADQYNIHDALK